MATNWFRNRALSLAIGLFMLSSVISGCEERGPRPPHAFLASAAAREAGARIFAEHCAICHGTHGGGDGRERSFMTPPPANLTVPPWSRRNHAGLTFAAIRGGIRGTAMSPWPTLSDRRIWELVACIEALGQGR